MIVGVVAYRFDYYPYTRNIVGIVPGIEYQKVKDLFGRINAISRLLNRVLKREILSTFDLNNQFYDFNLNKVDLLHFINGISYGKTPWISTYETILPRFQSIIQYTRSTAASNMDDRKVHRAFEALAGPNCKKIIAISACTANMQSELLSGFSDYKDSITNKMVVLHPPQELIVSRFDEKHVGLDNPLKFMFVGRAFFRKGGKEIVEVFKMLREKYHYELELTLVSSMQADGYAVPLEPETIRRTMSIIEENRDWIHYYPELPNQEALRLMIEAHVGLLPTYADTYGYSVLEFQACGCPVISTNIRSLPEINNSDLGWMIEVPKNRLGEAVYDSAEGRKMISEAIQSGLEKTIHEIYHDRSVIPLKSGKSILNIQAAHSKSDYSSRIKNIYLEALR